MIRFTIERRRGGEIVGDWIDASHRPGFVPGDRPSQIAALATARAPAVILASAIVLAGCSTTTWQKPGAASANFSQDANECAAKEKAYETAYSGNRGDKRPNMQYIWYKCIIDRGCVSVD